jgi:hypothetical protein
MASVRAGGTASRLSRARIIRCSGDVGRGVTEIGPLVKHRQEKAHVEAHDLYQSAQINHSEFPDLFDPVDNHFCDRISIEHGRLL